MRSALGLLVLLAACGGGGGDSPRDGDLDLTVDAGAFPDGGPGSFGPGNFRYGVNIGYRNPSFTDPMSATLAQRAGVRSLRVKLPAQHLEQWGLGIEVPDNQAYNQLGLGNHIGFLIGSQTREHSLMPAEAADWEIEFYPPRNLYEPIWLGDGTVNPDNHWARYIWDVVSTYKPFIRVWHVWNEPDYVDDWQVTQTWMTEPPTAEQLVRFRGSIFDYVRMMRIAHEVAHAVDPDCLVATGGIGYPGFLDAILRYSDNPQGGAVTAEYPATGAAYVDVIDFHYYPMFGPRSSDAAVDDYVAVKASLQTVLTARGKSVAGWNTSEIGAPLDALAGYPGGRDFAVGFLVKVMVTGQAAGVGGMDWFILSMGSGADPWEHMGLYEDVMNLSSIDQAQKTALGQAYLVMTTLLAGKAVDAAATTALGLPASVRGQVFTGAAGQVIVLWAAVPADSETASAEVTLPAPAAGFERYEWNGDHLGVPVVDGMSTVELGGLPVYLVVR
jgi:hypothetical protein